MELTFVHRGIVKLQRYVGVLVSLKGKCEATAYSDINTIVHFQLLILTTVWGRCNGQLYTYFWLIR